MHHERLFGAVKSANLLSYAMMFALTSFWLLWNIYHHR